VFQGIGPSKIKAKVMAAELALINYGALTAMTTQPTDVTDVCSADDYSADCCTESKLFFDFRQPCRLADQSVPWDTDENPASAGDENSATAFADNDVMSAVDDEDPWSHFIGKNPLTIVVELQLEARYHLLAETGDQLHPLYAMGAVIDGEMFRAAGTNKRLAKARAARNALSKIYNVEFGTDESK